MYGWSAELTFHLLPSSVPAVSYAIASGPVNSWKEDGAATTYPAEATKGRSVTESQRSPSESGGGNG